MVTVGIDPHKHVHVAVAVGDDGRPIGKPLTVENDALLIITLLKWFRSITDGTATWAVEDGRGFAPRLADGLLLAGQEVVWVPARLAAAHRRLHEATGSKSDPIDAAAVARRRSPRPDPGAVVAGAGEPGPLLGVLQRSGVRPVAVPAAAAAGSEQGADAAVGQAADLDPS